MCKAFHSLGNGCLQQHFGRIVHIILGTLAAVEVVSAGQCNSHGRERRAYGDQGPQNCCEPCQHEGNEIDEPVRQVVLGCSIAETHQQLRQERPEVDWFVICNVVCLHITQQFTGNSHFQTELELTRFDPVG